jgi:hypothetical protein
VRSESETCCTLDGTIPCLGHVSLAATYWCYNWDLARADQKIQRAIDLDPKLAKAYHLRAKFLGMLIVIRKQSRRRSLLSCIPSPAVRIHQEISSE